MSFQEKRSILSVAATGILAWIFVSVIAPASPLDPGRWGMAFLILVPAGVLLQILLMVVLSVFNKATTREDPPKTADERDRLISLTAQRNGGIVFALGFLVVMATQALGMPVSALFVSLAVSVFIASVVGEVSRFVYYRWGI